MQRSHFFLTSVEIMDNGSVSLSLPVALVSQRSVYRVFEESETIYQLFLEGRLFAVSLDGHACVGRLVRERGTEGSHYNIRLVQLQNEMQSSILENLRQYGFASPWKRKFPRLSVMTSSSLGETPKSIVFHRVAGRAVGEVINFSYNGLLFEFFCTGVSLGEYIGQRVRFDIVSSHGNSIYGIEAQITRIYDEMVEPGRLIRGLGVRFQRFYGDKRERYLEMVLEAAEALKAGSQ